MLENHYQTLGVSRDATHSTIKAAYHAKLLLLHPDKLKHQITSADIDDNGDSDGGARGGGGSSGGDGGDHELLEAVMRAWAVLKDSLLREKYDKALMLEGMKESASSINFYDEVNVEEMEEEEKPQEGGGGEEQGGPAYIMQCRCGDYFRLLKRTTESMTEGGSVSVPCDSCSNVIRVTVRF